jgi:hypothetical protein
MTMTIEYWLRSSYSGGNNHRKICGNNMKQLFLPNKLHLIVPIGSMYAIYGNIYHQYTPNVSIYTIHGSYGVWVHPGWWPASPFFLRKCQSILNIWIQPSQMTAIFRFTFSFNTNTSARERERESWKHRPTKTQTHTRMWLMMLNIDFRFL